LILNVLNEAAPGPEKRSRLDRDNSDAAFLLESFMASSDGLLLEYKYSSLKKKQGALGIGFETVKTLETGGIRKNHKFKKIS